MIQSERLVFVLLNVCDIVLVELSFGLALALCCLLRECLLALLRLG